MAELDGARLATARRDLRVRLQRIEVGHWDPGCNAFDAEGGIGLLIVRGFVIRRVDLAHRAASELLGPGDLIRPWQEQGDHAVYPFSGGWRVLDPVVVAVLDRTLARRLGLYPEITAALVGRSMARSQRVTGHLALAQLGSVHHRILVALWHLADEWGRVHLDGIVVPISLTHEILGTLVGARRPAVTSAIRELVTAGRVAHDERGYRLIGDPPADLSLIRGRRSR